MYKKKIDRKQVLSAIHRNDKQRFRVVVKDGKTYIGASQGHSFKVDPVHGTHYDFLRSILQHGLRPGGLREGHRQMVHCLPDSRTSSRYYPWRGYRASHFSKENGWPMVQVSQRLLHDLRDSTGQGYRNGLGSRVICGGAR